MDKWMGFEVWLLGFSTYQQYNLKEIYLTFVCLTSSVKMEMKRDPIL